MHCHAPWQMLDEGKVQGDGNATAQNRLDRRVAKFFALACSHGVAKGCVNYGVMQLDGIGGKKGSPADAMRTFRGACEMLQGAGCCFAADLLMQVHTAWQT